MDREPGDGGKDPRHIHLPGPVPFSFAGLWHNKTLGITSCTIITAAAAEPMRQLHDRRPVILDPAVYDAWLDPATSKASSAAISMPSCNSTKDRADSADMIEPLNPL